VISIGDIMDASETLIIRYLLGRLSPTESDQVEERFLSDNKFFDAVQAKEDELIRDYVCGALSISRRSDFEKKYLSNPSLKQKVLFAEALHSAAAARLVERTPTESLSGRLARWFPFRLPMLRLAEAFAVIAAAIGIWYGAHVFVRPPGIPETNVTQHPPSTASAPLIASYVLVPGVSRGLSEKTNDLSIPPNVQRVHLDLKILAPAGYRAYKVDVLAVGSTGMNPLVTIDDLPAEKSGAEQVVRLDLDASTLTNGDYVARLAGRTASGSYAALPSYSFRVERPAGK
jgi:hypothetical protein